MSTPVPLVSVIIPTLNESRWIGETVRAALAQELDGGLGEVIVVDCGSSDGTVHLARAAGAKVETVDRRSSYVARNRGMAVAGGEWLAFLDADCLPTPGWLSGLLACAREQGAEYVAGRIENELVVDNVANRLLKQRTAPEVRRDEVLAGRVAAGNMLVHRRVFLAIGAFEADASGADIRQSQRARERGIRIAYAGHAIVRHRCDLSTTDYLGRRYRIKRGQSQCLPRSAGQIARMLVHGLRPGLGEAIRVSRAIERPLAQVWPLLWAERAAESAGWYVGAMLPRPRAAAFEETTRRKSNEEHGS